MMQALLGSAVSAAVYLVYRLSSSAKRHRLEASQNPKEVSLMLHARFILNVQTTPVSFLEDHTVVVDEGVIIDVLPSSKAAQQYVAKEEEEFPESVLIPGLVNAHTHTPMTLLRGIADDVPLRPWLQEHIWPVEQKWVDEEFCRDGTELACAEMLRSGTTCFSDMYFFPEESAKVASQVGIRAVIGGPVLMFPSKYASSADQYLAKAIDLVNTYREHPLVRISISPHAPYTVSEQQLNEIRDAANDHGAIIHMHVHETLPEVEEEVQKFGKRPLARLEAHGLLQSGDGEKGYRGGHHFVGVHMTQLTDDEIRLLALRRASVVHCPESNTKLASGFCPVSKLLDNGVNVALGTDGTASNNDLNMFGEMRTAALMGKLESKDASKLSASDVLRMATINGARALGLEKRIGSIEVGKEADIVAVDLDNIECMPLFNVASHLVYSVGRENVHDVWVSGKRLLRRRQLTTIDISALKRRAKAWQLKIADAPQEKSAVVEDK